MCGLASVTVLSDSGTPVPGPAPCEGTRSVAGVVRTVLAEDFTNWACTPCVPQNQQWCAACEYEGYSRVAPAYIHTWWPSNQDPVYNYPGNAPNCQARTNYYYINGVPTSNVDGWHYGNQKGTYFYIGKMEDRLSIASNMTMVTNGTINNGTRQGTISVRVTASQNVPAGDHRLIVYLWEGNVSRTLNGDDPPYPNGETELDWATWMMFPNGTGLKIWQSGASPGQYVDYQANFTCGADWVLGEVGASVFVQNYATWDVEQAAVELFRGAQPKQAHDVGVFGQYILKNNVPARKTLTTNCTVYNYGTSAEGNVVVRLLLNGVQQGQTTIPSLSPGWGEYVSFTWNSPLNAGTYALAFNVTAISGETRLKNNQQSTNITVVRLPEAGAAPPSFNFTVMVGRSGYDNLTLSNGGTSNMLYNMTVGREETEFGTTTGTNYTRTYDSGNIYKATSSTTLFEIKNYMGIFTTPIPLYYFVYEAPRLCSQYTKIAQTYIASSGLGWGWHSSGAMNVNLTAGKYYYIGYTSGSTAVCYFYSAGNAPPIPAPFGSLETSLSFKVTSMPPGNTFAQGYTDLAATSQRLVTGIGVTPWLTVTPASGTVTNITNGRVLVKANASGLSLGAHLSHIIVRTNDPYHTFIRVPVTLNVMSTPASPYNIQIPSPAGPWPAWRFVSFPIDVSGPATVLLNDSINGDGGCAWDRAMWYDPTDSVDHWKQLIKAFPGGSQLSNVNNEMGLWIRITANAGDGRLTTGASGYVVPTTISLRAGWNMIGYPASNDVTYNVGQLKAATGATIVEGYNAGATYLTSALSDATVLKKGQAYWVMVPADTTWTVNW
jgi:hypothetical protein